MKQIFTILLMLFPLYLSAQNTEKLRFRKYVSKVGIKQVLDVSTVVQYPMGNSLVDNAIRREIDKHLGGTYKGDLKNGQGLVSHYANRNLNEACKDGIDTSVETVGPFIIKDSVFVRSETPEIITLCDDHFEYWGGNAGPIGTFFSISKPDGRVLGNDILKNTNTRDFKRLLFDGLKLFYYEWLHESFTDKQLLEHLDIHDFNELKYPSEPQIYITKKHVVIVYFTGEIDCMIAGQVESRIPIPLIRPYLKDAINDIIK